VDIRQRVAEDILPIVEDIRLVEDNRLVAGGVRLAAGGTSLAAGGIRLAAAGIRLRWALGSTRCPVEARYLVHPGPHGVAPVLRSATAGSAARHSHLPVSCSDFL